MTGQANPNKFTKTNIYKNANGHGHMSLREGIENSIAGQRGMTLVDKCMIVCLLFGQVYENRSHFTANSPFSVFEDLTFLSSIRDALSSASSE